MPLSSYPTRLNAACLTVCLKGWCKLELNLQQCEMREGMLGIILPDQIVLQRERSDDFSGLYIQADSVQSCLFPIGFCQPPALHHILLHSSLSLLFYLLLYGFHDISRGKAEIPHFLYKLPNLFSCGLPSHLFDSLHILRNHPSRRPVCLGQPHGLQLRHRPLHCIRIHPSLCRQISNRRHPLSRFVPPGNNLFCQLLRQLHPYGPILINPPHGPLLLSPRNAVPPCRARRMPFRYFVLLSYCFTVLID